MTRNLGSGTVCDLVVRMSTSEFACSIDVGVRGFVQSDSVIRLSEFLCSSVPS